MKFVSILAVVIAASLSSPSSAESSRLDEGRVVVKKMLEAIEKRDQAAFDAVVEKDAPIIVVHMVVPLNLDTPPAELECGFGKITKVEPSYMENNGAAVTVVWQCKPDEPEWDGRMAVTFHVGNGKVIGGVRS